MVDAFVSVAGSSEEDVVSYPPPRSNDVFISYSRKDKGFVKKLDAAFREVNRDPWVDWDDIQEGENWRDAIENGIINADTFIFVISPDSVASKECAKEIATAIKYSKRLIPIIRQEAEGVDPVLSALNWIYFTENDDFDAAFQKLLKAINTDLKHVQMHTRILGRAIEWEDGHDDGFLLRGKDLQQAKEWLEQCGKKEPCPTERHKNYIKKSFEVEAAAQRLEATGRKARKIILTSLIVCAGVVAIAASGVFIALQKSNRLQEKANELDNKIRTSRLELWFISTQQKRLEERAKELEDTIKKTKEELQLSDAAFAQVSRQKEALTDNQLKSLGWTKEQIELLRLKENMDEIVEQVNQANANYLKAVEEVAQSGSIAEKRKAFKVEYYPKNIDETIIDKALKALGFALESKKSDEESPINTILYGNDVDGQDVKLVAYVLIRAGVEIKEIRPFDSKRTDKSSVIQVGAFKDYEGLPPKTVRDIESAKLEKASTEAAKN
jgi:hypothetical protein